MNSVVSGKAIENLRNRIDVKLVSNKKDYLKRKAQSTYMSHKISENDLVATRKSKVTLTLNKPAFIGMCILQLSKILIYEFYYDYIKIKYRNNLKPLFTDTDSFINKIKDEDFQKDFCINKEMLDFSNYLTKPKYYDYPN